jgi:two-component system response regulator
MKPRSKRILLVDDNADDVDLALRAFARASVSSEIVVVRDGAEALEYLFATGMHAGRPLDEVPALVLLDIHLPKIDGLEVLRQLRADERTRRVPVVVLTSSREEGDIVRSYDFGANSFVRKPVAFEQFIEAAAHLCLYWLVLNQQSPR